VSTAEGDPGVLRVTPADGPKRLGFLLSIGA
jgi:hypothetical protein